MEKSFTIESRSYGYVIDIDGRERYFSRMDDLLCYAFNDIEAQFDKETKIIFSFKIEGINV